MIKDEKKTLSKEEKEIISDVDRSDKAESKKQNKKAEFKEKGKKASAKEKDHNSGEGKDPDSKPGISSDTETVEDSEKKDERYMRLFADFQNFKKRSEKERKDIFDYANEKLVTDMLGVLDNFERAIAQDCDDENYVEGMKLIFKQIKEVLEKAGLEEIAALEQEFNPDYHHAVMTEDCENTESGKVTKVLQKGYMLNKKVIRPSMVAVSN